MANKNKRIVLGVTGSIAAYKAADIIRKLQEKNFSVTVVMTKDAQRFITPLTLSTLSQENVYTDMFEPSTNLLKVPHVDLAKETDGVLIAPATANTLAKMAHGLADDLLTCLVLATKAPVLIAPAMNDAMYENEIVQDNCKKLKNFGFKFIDPEKGSLACGTIGKGRLADVDTIVKKVVNEVK